MEQNLPPAGQEAVGPLGGVMVVGRGGRGRYELVAENGGRPLAAPRILGECSFCLPIHSVDATQVLADLPIHSV